MPISRSRTPIGLEVKGRRQSFAVAEVDLRDFGIPAELEDANGHSEVGALLG
jgi:hypothetical protein